MQQIESNRAVPTDGKSEWISVNPYTDWATADETEKIMNSLTPEQQGQVRSLVDKNVKSTRETLPDDYSYTRTYKDNNVDGALAGAVGGATIGVGMSAFGNGKSKALAGFVGGMLGGAVGYGADKGSHKTRRYGKEGYLNLVEGNLTRWHGQNIKEGYQY